MGNVGHGVCATGLKTRSRGGIRENNSPNVRSGQTIRTDTRLITYIQVGVASDME